MMIDRKVQNPIPLFIIGHPKSGTSLLNSLLDQHYQLIVLSEESDYYSTIWPVARLVNLAWRMTNIEKARYLRINIKKKSHLGNYFRGVVENDISGNLDYRNFNSSKFDELLIKGFVESKKFKRRDLFLEIIEAFTEASNFTFDSDVKYWVEKTPKHTWYIDMILNDFPNAHFIYVCRDPRDNYVSYKKKWKHRQNPIKFCKSWNESIEIINNIRSNILKVRYEDLVEDPTRVMKRIAMFLSIEFSESMLVPTKLGNLWKGNSMFSISRDKIDDASVGRYKHLLSAEEAKIICAFCENNMLAFNYVIDDMDDLSTIRFAYADEYQEYRPVGNRRMTFRKFLGETRVRVIGKVS